MTETEFLKNLEKTLWTSANKLLPSLDAAVYKHVMLGLVFLKYVSDAFDERRRVLEASFRNEESDFYIGDDDELIQQELEIRDNYTEQNVFWVPQEARWRNLQTSAKLSTGAQLSWGGEFKGVGKMLDDAMNAIEKENPKLKGILNKDYARLQIEDSKLGELIDLITNDIPFTLEGLDSKDLLGHIYEYFLGEFAAAEGKKGGQYYTPKSIVNLIVEMIEPYKGRIYDPAMGSGGFFVSSEKFVETHKGAINQLSIYGQESNPTTWRLAAMNMVIRGLDFNFGKEPKDTLNADQHPDLRAEFVMANPPFNQSEWQQGDVANDKRWRDFGTPPKNNANFAWLLHMYSKLSADGHMGILLANGSMSSTTGGEGDIRQTLIDQDLIECMVALPGQLFTNTQIPACIWFLAKNKQRKGEVLFIDAREMGYMKDRVSRDFKPKDIKHIADTFHNWRNGEGYDDEAGYCKSAGLALIQKHDYVLTPGRYVGAKAQEEDTEPFEDKMARLTKELDRQFKQSSELEAKIRKNLSGLGYQL